MASYPVITADEQINAALVLANGYYVFGKSVGALGKTSGEICFNTALTGYQEILTDPSYSGQLITFTFPHIGNVGINHHDVESRHILAKGLILREAVTLPSNYRSQDGLDAWLAHHHVVGISGVDTRALTRHVRINGAVSSIIYSVKPGEIINIAPLLEEAKSIPDLKDAELAAAATTEEQFDWKEQNFELSANCYPALGDSKYHVVAIDYGAKHNILRNLTSLGVTVTVVPAQTSASDIMALQPDGVFLSNGPGDPYATSAYAVPVIQALLDHNLPMFGICLGHQLLALASGLKTEKMEQGHRGANHPVKELATNKVEITSQNHGFCVSKEIMPETVQITHQSLFDHTIQGIKRTDKPAFSVQYHPESSPGPHDSRYLFKRFVDLLKQGKA